MTHADIRAIRVALALDEVSAKCQRYLLLRRAADHLKGHSKRDKPRAEAQADYEETSDSFRSIVTIAGAPPSGIECRRSAQRGLRMHSCAARRRCYVQFMAQVTTHQISKYEAGLQVRLLLWPSEPRHRSPPRRRSYADIRYFDTPSRSPLSVRMPAAVHRCRIVGRDGRA